MSTADVRLIRFGADNTEVLKQHRSVVCFVACCFFGKMLVALYLAVVLKFQNLVLSESAN